MVLLTKSAICSLGVLFSCVALVDKLLINLFVSEMSFTALGKSPVNKNFGWDLGSNVLCRKDLFNADVMHSPRRLNKFAITY